MKPVKPRILIIDETLTGPVDTRKFLGRWSDRIRTNGITEYKSLAILLNEGLASYDLMIATPSFIAERAENIWPSLLPKFFNTSHCPRIIMVTDNENIKKSIAEIDDRLFFANTPHRASELVGGMLF